MDTPLNASATTAGALISSSDFMVPPYQREFSWQLDEVEEFWKDLSQALYEESYFLGLVILTEEDGVKQVVDGQQRIITLTLLAAALFRMAKYHGRSALADRLEADFLRSINYDTEETNARVRLSDSRDNETLNKILEEKNINVIKAGHRDDGSVSFSMNRAYAYLENKLESDLSSDPFKRLGKWAEFLTNRLYFAVFIHPDSSSAYQVFEVINTRGKELTTADLLKNYVLSQTSESESQELYELWAEISRQFSSNGSNSFVQYIRHTVTVKNGHILPKDLYDFLAKRVLSTGNAPLPPVQLMELLKEHLPLYVQMIDQTAEGPADQDVLSIFSAFNRLNVMSIRPVLISMFDLDDRVDAMSELLKLVVRRIVVGNLGTGNVERRFSELAKKINDSKNWRLLHSELADLNPSKSDFYEQLRKRSLNKNVLDFLRRSIVQRSITPEYEGTLHFIRPRYTSEWPGLAEEDRVYWWGTIGNTILAQTDRRPKGANNWSGVKSALLTCALEGENSDFLRSYDDWGAFEIEQQGRAMAEIAQDVWYD